MTTAITHWQFQGERGKELLWRVEEGAFRGFLTGALLGAEVVRVRLLRGEQLDEQRYALTDASPTQEEDRGGSLPYHSWIVVKGDEAWPSFITGSEAQETLAPYLGSFAVSETHLQLVRPLAAMERVFGFGERTDELDKRGRAFPCWNIDPPMPHDEHVEAMYTSIPFFTGLRVADGTTYGVLIDHTGELQFDIGKTNEAELRATVEGDSLNVYFFSGPTPADVLRQYSELTGRMPLPALWTLGYHQCRWSYHSEQVVRTLADNLRAHRIPSDAIWLDIDYMHGFRAFTWNEETFPTHADMIQALHAQGLHVIAIIDPGIKIDEEYEVYQEGVQRDYFCRYPNGEHFRANVWPGACVFPDYSRGEVRAWWGEHYKVLLDEGVDGIWNDMDEPSNAEPFAPVEMREAVLYEKTMNRHVLHKAGGDQPTGPDGPPTTHRFFHNAYGMQMARSSYEGQARLRPDARPFVLTRSGTAGMQRYAALWTGDNSSDWSHILLSIRMCLNVGMSGVPFVGSDVGGFWNNSNGELLTRFTQLGALMPFFRNHSAIGTANQEPWSFGEPYESACRAAIEVRYRLLPHLYTLFQEAATRGAPIMRPLYYHYPQDEQAADVVDEFLLGETLLSAPIYEQGGTSRNVYLPAGTWFDYWDGSEYPGERTIEAASPLDRWPLFIRANSILATGPLMQHTGERPVDPLTFTCYMASDGLASYLLYEDDGSSQAYRKGAFAYTRVSCRVDADTITVRIDEDHGGYQPPREQYEIVVNAGNRTVQKSVKAGQGTTTIHFA